jgi:fibronectin type 3 domain-containing protein
MFSSTSRSTANNLINVIQRRNGIGLANSHSVCTALQIVPVLRLNLQATGQKFLKGDSILLFVQFCIHYFTYSDYLKAARPLIKQSAAKVQRSLTAAVKLPGVKRACLNLTLVMPVMLIVFLMAPGVHSAQVTLAWDPNQENDLAGYRLYYGSASRNYSQVIDVGNANQHNVSGLAAGATYYFAVTAYNSQGLESNYSQELAHTTSIITYTITTLAGGNGRITPAGPVTVNQGTNQTFSMHPDQNFQVLNVKVDGVPLGTVTNYTFNNISADHTIEAEFASIGPPPAADSDNDGVPDDQDHFPNDPSETTDTDGDGSGNNADTDDDNDGMPDVWEIMHGLNPLVNDAAGDPDADGVSNLNEFLGATDPNAFEAFFKPHQPGLLSPADGEVVSLTPVLRTGAFSDPDLTDIHTTSRWQICRSNNQVCVFDKTSQAALTELVVPKLVLDENTSYEWRVRFEDNHGLFSEWSERVTFMTEYNTKDADGNGLPDDQEVAPGTDLDADGTPDIDQSDIKSVNVGQASTQIGISIPDTEPVVSIAALEAENPADIPNDAHAIDRLAEFPYGLISFKLIVSHPGDEVMVMLHLSVAASADGTWYKYDPVDDTWLDYSGYTEFSADRKRIYLTLKDGGFGDTDGIANGIIVDPLGFSDPSANLADTAGVRDSGGGGGGCFVSATGYDGKTNILDADFFKFSTFALALAIMALIFPVGRYMNKMFSQRRPRYPKMGN